MGHGVPLSLMADSKKYGSKRVRVK